MPSSRATAIVVSVPLLPAFLGNRPEKIVTITFSVGLDSSMAVFGGRRRKGKDAGAIRDLGLSGKDFNKNGRDLKDDRCRPIAVERRKPTVTKGAALAAPIEVERWSVFQRCYFQHLLLNALRQGHRFRP